MLSVKVAGQWLSSIGAYGPVTVEFGLHGSEAASWEMSPTLGHRRLRGNALVEIFDGGLCIWVGTLIEPGMDGAYAAKGIWRQAEDAPALNSSGAMSTVPNDIITGANTRGDISWNYATSISTSAWSTANGELSLANVLDGYAAETGTRWVVSPTRVVSMQADPTAPKWHVPHAVAGRGLTPAEDEFVTHLVATYLVSAGAFATETMGSADSAAVFGRRAVPVDLVPLGFITAARANAILTGMFLRAGARMGWAEGLDLAYGQIATVGGTVATLAQVQAGQMVRLAGTVDSSRAYAMSGHTDVVIASSRYREGSGRIQLTPLGAASRTLRDVLDLSLVSAT